MTTTAEMRELLARVLQGCRDDRDCGDWIARLREAVSRLERAIELEVERGHSDWCLRGCDCGHIERLKNLRGEE